MRSVIVASLVFSATAFALPPGAGPGLREGANHRVGDDSFVKTFGRAPTGADSEKLRMKTHLIDIRAKLAAASATKPELAPRRAELLGYLGDYIASGITPVNEHLPWRTPVFIDDHGNVCAVGYLIERSVGRALPEKIAAEHRYKYLEEIAAAMPEVRTWVETSGFTLDELASIQPGYSEPKVESWGNVDYVAMKAPDGAYTDSLAGGVTKGRLKQGHMTGGWTRTVDGSVVGKGTFDRGAGSWISFYPDGKKLANGPFVNDRPQGGWTLYHPSGNVAARGEFRRGYRSGLWQFYYDTKRQTPIALGKFSGPGSVVGTWRHYDAAGQLLATSRVVGKGGDVMSRGEILMTVVPGKDRVVHEIHALGGMDGQQLHMVARSGERLYIDNYGPIYDAKGKLLSRDGDGWAAASCNWGAKRRAIAASGDVSTLHRLLRKDSDPKGACGDPQPLPKARVQAITQTLGALGTIRAPSPEFVRDLAVGNYNDSETVVEGMVSEPSSQDEARAEGSKDLVRVLWASLSWYTEWPHIDGRFVALFPTLAGHADKSEVQAETRKLNPAYEGEGI